MLSLYMLILGLMPGSWLHPEFVLPLPWTVLAYEAWRSRFTWRQLGAQVRKKWLNASVYLVSQCPLNTWLTLVCLGGLLVILINTISYPFYRDDVLSRFAPNARLLFETANIPGNLTGYPLLVQLLYAFAFMASGGVNDHAAGWIVAAFAGGMVLVTFAIGRAILTKSTAWTSIILLLSCPLFVDWSTSGYVDVPVGVYHGLTFLLAFLWVDRGHFRAAILTGAMAGLALLTKQSALVLIFVLPVVPLLRGWPRRNFRAETIRGLAALATTLLIAGPWYLRNLVLAGSQGVLPAPGAYDAQFIDDSIQSLLTFIGDAGEWGLWFSAPALIGVALWIGVMFGMGPSKQKLMLSRRSALLLAAFILPYHVIWWQGFSYQTRYLLASAPLYAILAGHGAEWIIKRIPMVSQISRWPIIMLASTLVFLGSYKRIGAVYHLFLHPLQNDDAKLTRLSPDSWALVKHIRATIEPGSWLYVMDGTLAYWLHEYELRQGYPTYLADLDGYDYFVTAPASRSVYSFYGTTENEVVQSLGDQSFLPEVYRHSDAIAIFQVNTSTAR